MIRSGVVCVMRHLGLRSSPVRWHGVKSVDAVGARLARLRQLSLQSNRLTSMAGLGACSALEELYLSHNGITRIEVAPSPVSPPFELHAHPGGLEGAAWQ